ncbi:cytochrome P450 [Zychaea mexicana]|uniref:cytochrome P450 n=1 Tax=Zychaea mexicana TaxID=64656 RepID=UPI0022FF0B30|nr:cytochrome P450 [Zychaea mexicana]KAI9490640.1 cytochrome P450 [Zychaea mexicana]
MMSSQSLVREHLYSYRYHIGIAAAVSLICRHFYNRVFRAPKELQHIPAIPFWRQALSLVQKEPITLKTKRLVFPLISNANGIYVNRLPMDWTVYVTNPVYAKTILFKPEFNDKVHSFLDGLGEDHSMIIFVGKDNVATVNGQQWKNQRKIMNPVFHRSMPVALFGHLMPKVFRIIDEAESKDDHVVIVKLTQRLTLEALGKAIFGFEFGGLDQDNSVWVKDYNQLIESLLDPFSMFPRVSRVLRWISPSRREKHNAAYKLSALLGEMAEQRKCALLENKEQQLHGNVPDSEKDLLTLMLEAEMGGDGASLSKEELRHNLGIFFVAGHDTTSNSIAFTMYSLAVHKDIQTKARDEVLRILGDKPADVYPTLEDCKQFSYIDMIIKEGLRMYPPANDLLARRVAADVNLGGVMIPQGSMITVDIHALHHNPEVWKNPDQFIPERFADGGEHSKQDGVAWLPFSGGSRQCIGINFSMMEQRIALAMLLRKYDWELPLGSIHQNGVVFDQPVNMAPLSLKIKFNKRY